MSEEAYLNPPDDGLPRYDRVNLLPEGMNDGDRAWIEVTLYYWVQVQWNAKRKMWVGNGIDHISEA